ncbi:MAG: hypothetical protein DI565_09010 [Ancylobacter novellus]|uniref:DUF1795 domain-containing protein n=1 Tax=Ancylobacter novellus TaxID=921 RepID=A0A2W5KFV8_ANCNO|nr:MAG: hypothetical protein DI565_09010 [Ancylobacter novellus]
MIFRTAAAAAVLALAAGFAVAAEPARDEATGLAVAPPQGYTARKAVGDPRYAAVYAVQKEGEDDTGCKIAFQPTPSGQGTGEPAPTQEEINEFTRKKEWIDLIRATLALRYEVATVEPFELQGLSGAQVVADFKPIEGQAKPPDVRSYLVVLDTPKGRTTIVCVGDKASFDGRRQEFEAVARGVTPPR